MAPSISYNFYQTVLISVITSNPIIVDFSIILLEYAKLNERFDDFFTKVRDVKLHRKLMASILFERVIKRDCLENGWILVGYITSAADMEIMERQFYIIPNK